MPYLNGKQAPPVLVAVLFLLTIGSSCGKRPEIIKATMRPQLSERQISKEAARDHLSDGVASFRAGESEVARECLLKSTSLVPSDWMARYYLGLVEMSLVMLPEAECSLHLALTNAPKENRTRSRIYVALGQLAEMTGRTGQAQLDFQMALNLWPKSAAARLELDRLKQRSERADD